MWMCMVQILDYTFRMARVPASIQLTFADKISFVLSTSALVDTIAEQIQRNRFLTRAPKHHRGSESAVAWVSEEEKIAI